MPWDDPNQNNNEAASFYRRIWQLSGRSQVTLIGLSIIVSALAAAPLHFQKELVNGLTYGISFSAVLLLGAQYASAIVVTILVKGLLKYRSAMLGESIVRRIRRRIYTAYAEHRASGAPPKLAPGTLVSMLTGEADKVGHFVGDAFAGPLVQIGTLLSVLLYIGAGEPILGLFILAVIAPQFFIIVAIQKPINRVVRTNLELLRAGGDLAVSAVGIEQDDEVLATFEGVYEAKKRFHLLKLSMKSALNACTAFGTVGTLVLGGWLVINGDTDVGTVVAALSGLTRLARPWNDLVAFYRSLNSVRVRFKFLEETMA
ncbi:ABC transporter transmembrane domain-containing protein [Microvirga antarctica]|uniref:ABC transporter transmembrane domain-containing protein n=1 Tax=Microvirga antarctica TaxID=2819233 RepID=UPI001B304C55|nr:ABC transporter transmembrane domain-containing protein [Microvirga antarctica]